MRIAMTLFVAMFTCISAWAQYVAIYADPYSAGMVQVGTEIDLDPFSDGASFTVAAPGETVYFSYQPYNNYRFKGIRYKNLSDEDVTELQNGIYSFTMPDYSDEEFWVSIFIELEKIPEIVTGVNINNENFPDEKFRNWLLSQSYGKDAVITDAEMAGITKITALGCGIEDLTGIQFFTELTELDVSNFEGTHPEEQWNHISTIDLSGNTKLRVLWADNNQIASIDLSPCSELRKLGINNNVLTKLDVSNNTLLSMLSCENNQLTTLEVTDNPNLAVLSCNGNKLTKLDVTNNSMLEQLFCENNQLTTINVTNKDKLMLFNCNGNQLTSLNVTGCPSLFQLYCYDNQITGQAMTDLVSSLPEFQYAYMVVMNLDSGTEQNAITKEQAAIAIEKGWSVEAIENEDFIPYPKVSDDEHEYVDLGLTSGTLWATCNVGAKRPQDIGLYFAWGDTEGHGNDITDGYLFDWENYKWGEVSGEETYFTKYCTDSSRGKDGFTDGKYELDPEDDAAYVNWGSQWRTPSKEQLDELKAECEWTLTTVGGVNGYEVRGTNGNTIFLPETGWRIDDMLLDGGAYWSRSANPENMGGAYFLGWDEYGEYEYGGRLDGQCVRPVVCANEVIELADDTDNSEAIEAAVTSGKTCDVKLSGHTFFKDGSWNTLCLPFDVTASQLAETTNPFYGADIRTLSSSSFENGTLTLNFTPATGEGAVTEITAGTPYIIRWTMAEGYENDDEHNIVSPVFNGVTLTNATPTNVETESLDVTGFYSPLTISEENKQMLYLGTGNKIYYPKEAMNIYAFRAVFTLNGELICGEPDNGSEGINKFVLNFGNDETGIIQIKDDGLKKENENDSWFTIDGLRLSTKPIIKGVYINNGHKVIIK